MHNFDPTNNISWQLGHRGRVAVFIDGNNLFHAARFHNIDIDYNKLLRVLLGDGRLLRAFFYTGVDVGAERQQGFLLWMRRNGFRVIQKELKTFYDGTRKANLDVEIAVDMLSLAGRYDTAVLVSGDEDFVYAVNAVAYKGCRVEIAVSVRTRRQNSSTFLTTSSISARSQTRYARRSRTDRVMMSATCTIHCLCPTCRIRWRCRNRVPLTTFKPRCAW